MKKANCSLHGDYVVNLYSLPECPDCLKLRFVFTDAEDPKHAPVDAASVTKFKSFRSDQISAGAIFDYMRSGDGTNPTGCKVYYYPKEKSYNAVSLLPCGKIPGSGAKNGSAIAAELAVLQDMTGKSSKGPHFSYEDMAHFNQRIQNKEWIEAPKCNSCQDAYVYVVGGVCPACIQSGQKTPSQSSP